MNKFNSFRPLMHEHEYKFIEKYLNKDDVLLEYGSGNSTLYFSDFVKKLISLEHDVDYYNSIKKCIDAYSADNVELYHVEPTIRDKKVKRHDQLKDYIEFPVKRGFKFNRILIDGRARKECAIFIYDHISNDDIVFIHDFNSNNVEGYVDEKYHYDILEKYDIIEFDTRGQGIVALKKTNFNKNYNLNEHYTFFSTNKTDKGTIHSYIENYYSKKFTPLKNNKINLLEIGIFQAHSIKLWKDWFVNGSIYCIDTHQEFIDLANNIPDTKCFLGDAYNQDMLDKFDDNFFDIIIDDGPHTLDSQEFSVAKWSKKLKKNGVLIIEDVRSLGYIDSLIKAIPNNTEFQYKVFNFISSKKRSDDIIFEVTKI